MAERRLHDIRLNMGGASGAGGGGGVSGAGDSGSSVMYRSMARSNTTTRNRNTTMEHSLEEKALGEAGRVAAQANRQTGKLKAEHQVYKDLIDKYRNENETLDKETLLLESLSSTNQSLIMKNIEILKSLQERTTLEDSYMLNKNMLEIQKKKSTMQQINSESVDRFNKILKSYGDFYQKMPLMQIKKQLLQEASLLQEELQKIDIDTKSTVAALKIRDEKRTAAQQTLILKLSEYMVKGRKEYDREICELQVAIKAQSKENVKLKKELHETENELKKACTNEKPLKLSPECQLPFLNFKDSFVPLFQLSVENHEEVDMENKTENLQQSLYEPEVEPMTQKKTVVFEEIRNEIHQFEPTQQSDDVEVEPGESMTTPTSHEEEISESSTMEVVESQETFEAVNECVDVQGNNKITVISDDVLEPEQTVEMFQQIKRAKFSHHEEREPTVTTAVVEEPVIENIDRQQEQCEGAKSNETEIDSMADSYIDASHNVSMLSSNSELSGDESTYFTAKKIADMPSPESHCDDENSYQSFANILNSRFLGMSPERSLVHLNVDEDMPAGGSSLISPPDEAQPEKKSDNNVDKDDFSFTFGKKSNKKNIGFFSSLF